MTYTTPTPILHYIIESERFIDSAYAKPKYYETN